MASRSWSADPTRTTSTAAGSVRSAVCAATRVTCAPRCGGDPRERVALAPGGPVAEEADGIERLAGAARGDDDAPALEIAGQRGGTFQQEAGQLGDLGRLRQPAGPGVLAGEAA